MSGNVNSKRKPCKLAFFTLARKQSVGVPKRRDCLVVAAINIRRARIKVR